MQAFVAKELGFQPKDSNYLDWEQFLEVGRGWIGPFGLLIRDQLATARLSTVELTIVRLSVECLNGRVGGLRYWLQATGRVQTAGRWLVHACSERSCLELEQVVELRCVCCGAELLA